MGKGFDLRSLAHTLGGEVSGRQVLAPGPGHSRRDRSLSVRISSQAPDGFVVFSHAGDDFGACRDYVADRLGLGRGTGRNGELRPTAPPTTSGHEDALRTARAVEIWHGGRDPSGTVVERYLASRGLALPECASDVIRYHPRCPWGDKARGETIFVPAMVAVMRSVADDRITAVHRTRLTDRGEKMDRMMFGPARGSAVKIDPDADVTSGLTVGEGIETCLAARQIGFRPLWAATMTGNLKTLPVLPGVEVLSLLAEHDRASDEAVRTCSTRWVEAGRDVVIVRSLFGSDMNDALRATA